MDIKNYIPTKEDEVQLKIKYTYDNEDSVWFYSGISLKRGTEIGNIELMFSKNGRKNNLSVFTAFSEGPNIWKYDTPEFKCKIKNNIELEKLLYKLRENYEKTN